MITGAIIVGICYALATGGLIAYQWKSYRLLKAKLKKLSATEDEILCILEATDSPMALRLLEVARSIKHSPALPKATTLAPPAPISVNVVRIPNEEEWKTFVGEMRLAEFDPFRINVLRSYLNRGYRFNNHQRLAVIGMMAFPPFRDAARALLDHAEVRG